MTPEKPPRASIIFSECTFPHIFIPQDCPQATPIERNILKALEGRELQPAAWVGFQEPMETRLGMFVPDFRFMYYPDPTQIETRTVVLELDGKGHLDHALEDRVREAALLDAGVDIIYRFTGNLTFESAYRCLGLVASGEPGLFSPWPVSVFRERAISDLIYAAGGYEPMEEEEFDLAPEEDKPPRTPWYERERELVWALGFKTVTKGFRKLELELLRENPCLSLEALVRILENNPDWRDGVFR